MFFYYPFFDWTYIILLPALIFAFFAQIRVKSAFEAGNRIKTSHGITGAKAARKILDDNGLYDISIERVGGHLTDHFDPKEGVIRLSESVYDSTSAAAVGVAAHEAGHALQDARGYVPLRFRIALVPVCNIGSNLAMPLFFIGLLMAGLSVFADWLMLAGIAAFSLSVFFQLVTLPVEFNASRRALHCLEGSGTMTNEQLKGSRKVLSAAAMTYVAALAVGLLSLLRLLLIAMSASSRRER